MEENLSDISIWPMFPMEIGWTACAEIPITFKHCPRKQILDHMHTVILFTSVLKTLMVI